MSVDFHNHIPSQPLVFLPSSTLPSEPSSTIPPPISNNSSPSFVAPLAHIDSHPMMTQAKSGISKPKAYPIHTVFPSSKFLHSLLALKEPQGFKSASKHPEWLASMNEEMQALQVNKTWTLVSRLSHKNVVGCHWVFTPASCRWLS